MCALPSTLTTQKQVQFVIVQYYTEARVCVKNFLMLTVTIFVHFHPSPFSATRTLSHSHTGTPANHETRKQTSAGELGRKGELAEGEKWEKGEWRTWATAVKSGSRMKRKEKYHFWICQLWGTCLVFMVLCYKPVLFHFLCKMFA